MHAKVAYFSMEIMLRTHIPTYAGGLGVLAGDMLRSCADMKIPAVGMTLVYKGTAFIQQFHPDGSQTYSEIEWRKSDQFTKMPQRISLKINGENVSVGCWRFDIVGFSGFVVPVYLLDTDYYTNAQWMRDIAQNLYAGKPEVRFCQEILLGVGGVQMLQALGYNQIDCYHLNEGHAALAPLALLPESNWKDEEVRKKTVFTTHTPIPEGHDIFDYDLAYKYADGYLPWHIRSLSDNDKLHMTKLALNMSKYACAVSKKHAEISRQMFPGYAIDSITNGVHHRTWTASTMQDLYNEFLPGWIDDPTQLKKAVDLIPNDKLWRAHQETKKNLIDFVNHHLTSTTNIVPEPEELFDVNTLTLALARRPVRYKRPLLIYRDLERLIRISAGKIQIIQSGKSHPEDDISHEIVKKILHISKKLKGVVRIVYLENYSPKIARMLVSGSDIWLNTPSRPLEASGTSGMKAAMNGGLNFSVLDGWWIEGFQMCPQAGFAIGKSPDSTNSNDDHADSEDLYEKLEHIIIPLYYENSSEWIARMKYAIALGAYFNTHRVVEEYTQKAWDKK